MKELSIEEKAQRFDEALKAAVVAHKDEDKHLKATLERIFPELKGSEDEKVRKAIRTFILSASREQLTIVGVTRSDMLAYLEKRNGNERENEGNSLLQGEQKPTVEIKTPEESLGVDSDTYNKIVDECVYGEQKPAWSEEDEKKQNYLIALLQNSTMNNPAFRSVNEGLEEWLKSLKDRYTWKPSDEMLEALYRVIPGNVMEESEDEMLLDKLYQGLKYGRVL